MLARGKGKRQRPLHRQPLKARGQPGALYRAGLHLQETWSRHRDIIRALIIYACSLAALLLLYSWITWTSVFLHFLEYNAQATGFLVRIFNPAITVTGTTVMSDGFAILVVPECTILAPLAIFIAAVAAVPASLFRRVLGIVLGFSVLLVVNLVRTTSLFYIGSAFPSALEIVHLLVWQSIMVVLAVTLWLLWMKKWALISRPSSPLR